MHKLRNRRNRLWAKDPRCKLCGVVTLLPDDVIKVHNIPEARRKDFMRYIPLEVKNKLATIDHEVNRFDPRRRVQEGKERTRLACFECNTKRGNTDYAALPIEERRRRAKHERPKI